MIEMMPYTTSWPKQTRPIKDSSSWSLNWYTGKSQNSTTIPSLDLEILEKPDAQWDKFLLESPYGNILQSTRYAEYVQKYNGSRPIYVRFFARDICVGELMLYRSIRLTPLSRRIPIVLSRIATGFFMSPSVYQWWYGPVTSTQEFRRDIYQGLRVLIRNILRNPLAGINSHCHPLLDYDSAFEQGTFQRLPSGTFLIDLKKDEKTLWSNIRNDSGRRSVNRALKRGVTVREIFSRADFDLYLNILNERRSRSGEDNLTFKELWGVKETLKDNIKFFLAERKSEALSGVGITVFNGYLNELFVAQSSNDVSNRYCSSDLLQWHVIQWGHLSGQRYYDLSGVLPESDNPKFQGMFRFKEKWGGDMLRFNRFIKLPFPLGALKR